jgi:hypothetical protein
MRGVSLEYYLSAAFFWGGWDSMRLSKEQETRATKELLRMLEKHWQETVEGMNTSELTETRSFQGQRALSPTQVNRVNRLLLKSGKVFSEPSNFAENADVFWDFTKESSMNVAKRSAKEQLKDRVVKFRNAQQSKELP